MTTMTTPATEGGACSGGSSTTPTGGRHRHGPGHGHSSVRVPGGRTPSPSSSSIASSAPVSPIAAAALGSPSAGGPPPLLYLLQHATGGGEADGWGADPTASYARLLVGIAEKGRLPRLRLALSQIESTHPDFLPSPQGRLALRLSALAAGGRGHWECLTHLVQEHRVPVARLSEGETEAAAARWGPHLLLEKLPPAPPGLGAAAAEEAALHAAARAWLLAPPLVAAAAAGDVVQALKLAECAAPGDIKALALVPSSLSAAIPAPADKGAVAAEDSVLHLLADGGLWRRHGHGHGPNGGGGSSSSSSSVGSGSGSRRERTQSHGSALSGSIGGSLVSCCEEADEEEGPCPASAGASPTPLLPHTAEDQQAEPANDARAPALAALIRQLAAAAPALLHKRDRDGHLPICRAAATGHALALRLLLEAHRQHGGLADVELALRRPCQQKKPGAAATAAGVAVPLLAHAMRNGRTRCLRLLLLDPHLAKQHQGRRTPLVDASAPCGHTALLPSAAVAIEGSSTTITTSSSTTSGMLVPCLPHHLAALHAWEPALRWLLEHGGVGIDALVSATGHTALHFVCLGGVGWANTTQTPQQEQEEAPCAEGDDNDDEAHRLRLARWLVEEKGADPSVRDRLRGETPAEAAARVGRTSLAAYLLPLALAAEEAALAAAEAAAKAKAAEAAAAAAASVKAKEEEEQAVAVATAAVAAEAEAQAAAAMVVVDEPTPAPEPMPEAEPMPVQPSEVMQPAPAPMAVVAVEAEEPAEQDGEGEPAPQPTKTKEKKKKKGPRKRKKAGQAAAAAPQSPADAPEGAAGSNGGTPPPPPAPPTTPLEEAETGKPKPEAAQQPFPKLTLPPSILQLAAGSASTTSTMGVSEPAGSSSSPTVAALLASADTLNQRRRRRLARLSAALGAGAPSSAAAIDAVVPTSLSSSLLLRVPPLNAPLAAGASPVLSTLTGSHHAAPAAHHEAEECCERSRTGSLSSLSLSLGVPEEDADADGDGDVEGEGPSSPTGSCCSFFSAQSQEGEDRGDLEGEEEEEEEPMVVVKAVDLTAVAAANGVAVSIPETEAEEVVDEEEEAPVAPVAAAAAAAPAAPVAPAAVDEDEKQEVVGPEAPMEAPAALVKAVAEPEKKAADATGVASVVPPPLTLPDPALVAAAVEAEAAKQTAQAPEPERKVEEEKAVEAPVAVAVGVLTADAPAPASPTSLLKQILFRPSQLQPQPAAPAPASPVPPPKQLEQQQPAEPTPTPSATMPMPVPMPKPSGLALPPEFCCPLTKRLLQDPYIGMDGVTYEGAALQEYFAAAVAEGRPVLSPSTGEPMAPVCVPNHSLKLLIKDFLRTAARKQAKQQLLQQMQMQQMQHQGQQQTGVPAA